MTDYELAEQGDYAAALRLLETVCQRSEHHYPFCRYLGQLSTTGEWNVVIVLSGRNEVHKGADTLPLAISLACRDALLALKGDTDDGTN